MENLEMTQTFAAFIKMNELLDQRAKITEELKQLGDSLPAEVRQNLVGLRKALLRQGLDGQSDLELT